jgi:Tfp pilus assembly protein PilF
MRWLKSIAPAVLVAAVAYLAWIQHQGRRWQSHFDSAQGALNENRLAEARAEADASLESARVFGPRDVRRACSLIAVGYADVGQARDWDAERRFREALNLLESRCDSETVEASDALNGLAIVAGHRVQDAEARRLLERALAIQQKVLGPEHPVVARSLNNLGWVCCNEGHYAEAERLSRQALAIKEKSLGPEQIDVLRNRCDLASFLMAQAK